MPVDVVRGKITQPLSSEQFVDAIRPYRRLVLDIGAGDGKFVMSRAALEPETLFVGLDPASENLAEASAKSARKPTKGGRPNVLFIRASAEAMPRELDGLAAGVYILMPWGRLLDIVATGEPGALAGIARVAAAGACLEVLINYSIFYGDRMSADTAHLPPMSERYVDEVMSDRYLSAGFEIVERAMVAKEELAQTPTTWARRLAYGREPSALRFRATRVG